MPKSLRAERVENATTKLARIFAKKMLQKGASVERFAAEWRHSWKRLTHGSPRSQKFLPCNELARILEKTANWRLMGDCELSRGADRLPGVDGRYTWKRKLMGRGLSFPTIEADGRRLAAGALAANATPASPGKRRCWATGSATTGQDNGLALTSTRQAVPCATFAPPRASSGSANSPSDSWKKLVPVMTSHASAG
jgi:hypothetical protein